MDPPGNPHGGPGMRVRVLGEPIAVKSGKKTAALKAWIERVRAESESRILPPGRYRDRLAFVLPRERYQATDLQNPHGKDLDNLVAPVLDRLSRARAGRVAVVVRAKDPRGPPAPGLLLRLLAEPHAPRDQGLLHALDVPCREADRGVLPEVGEVRVVV